jgi:hypothetical protein
MAQLAAVVALVALFVGVRGEEKGAQSYPFCFMNITTDRAETGFIQVYGMAVNSTSMLIEANNDSFHDFKQLQVGLSQMSSYNTTPGFGSVLRQSDPASTDLTINNFGIIVSSNEPVYVIGVKSDKGTSDAYRVLPLVDTSTEFFIAGWRKEVDRNFLAVIMVVGAEDDTCVEIYKVTDGTNYRRLQSQMGGVGKYQVYRYFASTDSDEFGNQIGEDVTGYFVNTTKPVGVYFGHECAWVPSTSVLFCDYLVEQIPPVSQLGQRHVVPPIMGRNPAAGYVVRVVCTQPGDTTVKFLGETRTCKAGQFIEFQQPNCGKATFIDCSAKCLVMQYNKGYQTIKNPMDTPTDPFMMMVVPDDRFTAGAGIATANFCLEKDSIIEFDNYVSIVTFYSCIDNIRFDDQPLSSPGIKATWTKLEAGPITYGVTSFRIKHDYHWVNLAPNTFCSFAVYVYGHSYYKDSSSAYGYSANYNITGTPVTSLWEKASEKYKNITNIPGQAAECESESELTGAILKDGFSTPVYYPFTLKAGVNTPMTLSATCKTLYEEDLLKLLRDFSRKINEWICKAKNCSYLGGVGVAIDYDLLKVEWIGSGDVYNAVQIYVPMMASMDASAKDFAQCRADIMAYVYEFINWPPYYTKDLIASRTQDGCPWPILFVKPQFDAAPQQCPAIN